MKESQTTLGEIGAHLPADPWVLVLGGVTREGNRRARRAVREATSGGLSAIWFDGFDERYEDAREMRVELGGDLDYSNVVVVCYADEERAHWLNSAGDALTQRVEKGSRSIEEKVSGRFDATAKVLRRIRMWVEKLARRVRKLVLRRLSQIFRGLVGWSLIESDIVTLERTVAAPMAIVYGDDHAFTQAWRVAKIWTHVPVSTELRNQ